MSVLVAMHEEERQRLHRIIAEHERTITNQARSLERDRGRIEGLKRQLADANAVVVLRDQTIARLAERRDQLVAENAGLQAERDHALGLLESMLRGPDEDQIDAVARLVGQGG